MGGTLASAVVDRSLLDQLSAFAGRGACTDAERRAAAALHDDLRARGHEAWVEARWTRPQANVSLLLHTVLVVAGSLASVGAPVVGAVIAGIAALSLVVEAAGRTGPLRLLFPRRATQHVLTVPGGEGVALIVSARYDAPRTGMLRAARLRRLAARLPVRPLTLLAGCAGLVAACAITRAAGVDAAWLGAVQLVPTLVLLLAAAAAFDRLGAAWSAAANDNASGVAAALALHDELARRPPSALSPGLLLHGAGAPGPQALRAHLRGEKLGPREALVLEIGPSGAGAPAWATRHSQVRAAARRADEALGLTPQRGLRAPEGTGRLPAISLGALDATGIAPDGDADPTAVDAVVDLALAVVDALDAELSARRATVNAG
jgi:hypothetical protein